MQHFAVENSWHSHLLCVAATAPVAASSNPVGYHGIGPSTHGAGSGRGYRHN